MNIFVSSLRQSLRALANCSIMFSAMIVTPVVVQAGNPALYLEVGTRGGLAGTTLFVPVVIGGTTSVDSIVAAQLEVSFRSDFGTPLTGKSTLPVGGALLNQIVRANPSVSGANRIVKVVVEPDLTRRKFRDGELFSVPIVLPVSLSNTTKATITVSGVLFADSQAGRVSIPIAQASGVVGLDSDGDGYFDADELQLGSDPTKKESKPSDLDGDFIPDKYDSDRDGDGVPNDQDFRPDDPSDWQDTDSDLWDD